MIREMQIEDIDSCAEIMMSVYNNEHWQCNWDFKTAKAYLLDYYEVSKFIGFVLVIDERICGAIFCHEKIWWNNNEVLVDEMFIHPKLQRKGYGAELSTNRFTPAPDFYRKNGFADADHVLFMYKEV